MRYHRYDLFQPTTIMMMAGQKVTRASRPKPIGFGLGSRENNITANKGVMPIASRVNPAQNSLLILIAYWVFAPYTMWERSTPFAILRAATSGPESGLRSTNFITVTRPHHCGVCQSIGENRSCRRSISTRSLSA